MGVHPNISRDSFPQQSKYLGCKVTLCFHYNSKSTISGFVVRDDIEEPFKTIFQTIDGRYILATECQYRLT